jgi:hypothetical protein
VTKSDVAKELRLYTEDIDALIFGLSIETVSEGTRVANAEADETRRRFKLYSERFQRF